jgi:hypothetical protein
MNLVARVTLLAAAALFPGVASAQNCAGFTDVPDTDPFCSNIQWIKSRGVTQGCTATTYCPSASVLRIQMAAFMNRLGTALTPQVLSAQAVTGAIVLPAAAMAPALHLCETGDTTEQVAPVQYERQASVTASISGLGDASGASWNAFVHVSTDGGMTWSDLNPGSSVGIRTSSAPGAWASNSATERMDLAPGVTYRFAIGVRRDGVVPSTGNLTDGRCQIVATVSNRNPAPPPAF